MAERTKRQPPRETPKAAEAFAAYVAMGPGRSYAKLAKVWGHPASYVGQIDRWARAYRWQDRLVEAITTKTQAALADANELDAVTFSATSRVLAETMAYTTHHHADVVIKVRESVRPKSASTIEHKHSGEVRHTYDLSRLSPDELANLRALAEKYETEGAPV